MDYDHYDNYDNNYMPVSDNPSCNMPPIMPNNDMNEAKPECKMPKGSECGSLARIYIPMQKYTSTFPPKEAFMKGTMFPELYRPYRETKC